jgi:hypothetical protein
MKQRIARILVVVLILSVMNVPLTILAVSYPPSPLYHRGESQETALRGDIVYLFHSGGDKVRAAIHPEDVVAVYRISPSCEVRAVGKIKVVSYIGETYLKGEVVEGEIKPNDIAKKAGVSCLVILAVACGSGQ